MDEFVVKVDKTFVCVAERGWCAASRSASCPPLKLDACTDQKRKDLAEAKEQREAPCVHPGSSDGVTLMIRNLPKYYSQHHLLTKIQSSGFLGSSDYLYMPVKIGSHGNRGYAFLNLRTERDAATFKKQWHGSKLEHDGGAISISRARLQGLQANVDHSNTDKRQRIKNPKYKPKLLASV